ncbi:MAG: 1-acyl-sn-glycerol-3-phosphate acyltransferase [Paludibacteraceae bacterium]|nr:1-acyl-sn-glycerol-3-phosphate acyltransferase [Paludibacteraceae bacterium]
MLKLKKGIYLPDVGIEYPTDDPYKRLVPVKKVKDIAFDANYTYLDDSLSFKIQHFLNDFIAFVHLYIVNKIVYGMHYRGREILKKYRKEFSNGVVSICNHCYRYDGAAIAQAFRRHIWIPMLKDHLAGNDAWLLKYFGGIPVPDDLGGMRKFNQAFDELHRRKQWILVFPEARNWYFYKPIKPFKKGAFSMAYKYNIPILPINISYRKRTGIYRLFGKKETPLLTLTIGEPIFPDITRPHKDEVDRLLRESHAAMCEMAGIEENPWPPFWNKDKEL